MTFSLRVFCSLDVCVYCIKNSVDVFFQSCYSGAMEKQLQTLTKKQKTFYDLLESCFAESGGVSPTIEELKKKLKVSSYRTVTQYLEALEKKGLISRSAYQKRGIKLLNPRRDPTSDMILLPVIASAGCDAQSVYAEHRYDDFISVDPKFLNGQRDYKNIVAIKAVGNSMTEAGIQNGDYVLTQVKENIDFNNGDKVVAIVGDMAVIKKVRQTANATILYPASKDPNYKPIIMKDNSHIFGRVIEVIRADKSEELTIEPIIEDYPVHFILHKELFNNL